MCDLAPSHSSAPICLTTQSVSQSVSQSVTHSLTHILLSFSELKQFRQNPVQGASVLIRFGVLCVILLTMDTMLMVLEFKALLTDSSTPNYFLLLLSLVLTMFVRCASMFVLFIHHVSLGEHGSTDYRNGFVLYVKFVSAFVEACGVFSIFVAMVTEVGMPLFILYDTYTSFRNLVSTFFALGRFQSLSRHMDAWFPDEDLTQAGPDVDRTCVICRDEMTIAKRVDCGHRFHRDCLLGWIQTNDSCPICRRSIIPRRPHGGIVHRPHRDQHQDHAVGAPHDANLPPFFGFDQNGVLRVHPLPRQEAEAHEPLRQQPQSTPPIYRPVDPQAPAGHDVPSSSTSVPLPLSQQAQLSAFLVPMLMAAASSSAQRRGPPTDQILNTLRNIRGQIDDLISLFEQQKQAQRVIPDGEHPAAPTSSSASVTGSVGKGKEETDDDAGPEQR
jgi:hypothetical protein